MPIDGQFIGATVETGRIANVNVQDWSVDVISEHGNKKYFDIQLCSPYFHYMNCEGIYVMPEVGAMCWVCKPSDGRFSTPFVIGFQAPFDDKAVGYRAGRPQMNPGDIMMKTRDENFIILRRGGVVQIGATPTAQRMFIPVRNFIKDFCENYQLFTFGGEMTWTTARTEETTTGDALTTFALKAKEKANDPGFIAELTVGSHGQNDATILNLVIKDSGLGTAAKKIQIQLTKNGDVSIDITQDLTIDVDGLIKINGKSDLEVSITGETTVNSTGNLTLDTQGKAIFSSVADTVIKSSAANAELDGKILVKIGTSSPLPLSPVVRGTELEALLNALLNLISTLQCPAATAAAALITAGTPPATPVVLSMIATPPVLGAAAAATLLPMVPPIKSTKVLTG